VPQFIQVVFSQGEFIVKFNIWQGSQGNWADTACFTGGYRHLKGPCRRFENTPNKPIFYVMEERQAQGFTVVTQPVYHVLYYATPPPLERTF
jgi:hypothetical protein